MILPAFFLQAKVVGSPKKGFSRVCQSFAMVVWGGRQLKSFQERMIGINPSSTEFHSRPKNDDLALLESVSANLEAGMRLLDQQELSWLKSEANYLRLHWLLTRQGSC